MRDGLRLHKRRVMGIERVEIAEAYGAVVRNLRHVGCRTEVVMRQTRVFVPTENVLGKVLARYPVVGGGG